MTIVATKLEDGMDLSRSGSPRVPNAVRTLVMARIAAGDGATKSELIKDLTPFASHRLAPSELRMVVDSAVGELVASAAVDDQRGRLRLTASGLALAQGVLGTAPLPKDWARLRDGHVTAVALGVEPKTAPRLRALAKSDGLRAAILVKTFELSDKLRSTPAMLRAQLAVVALERAFGNKIKSGLGSGKDLPAKASRLLAAQLCQRPRDLGTDSRLISTLAAEAVGAAQPGDEHLRVAIIRRWLGASLAAHGPTARSTPLAAPEVDQRPPRREPAARPSAASRPDLIGFAAAVQKAARTCAEGWPGNRKALIAKLFPAIGMSHPEWGLTEIEFKTMLAEAHRTGHVVLVTADLKGKANLKELQQSAVAYKNTVWHLVRIEE